MITEEILQEAKRRYKIGMKVVPAHCPEIKEYFTITESLWEKLLEYKPCNKETIYLAGFGPETNFGHILYFEGKWAEIVEDTKLLSKFKIGDKVKVIPGGWISYEPESIKETKGSSLGIPTESSCIFFPSIKDDLTIEKIKIAKDGTFWYKIIGYNNLISEEGLAFKENTQKESNLEKKELPTIDNFDPWSEYGIIKEKTLIDIRHLNRLPKDSLLKNEKFWNPRLSSPFFNPNRTLIDHKICFGKDYFLISITNDLWVDIERLIEVMQKYDNELKKLLPSSNSGFLLPIILKKTPVKPIIII